MLMRCQQSPKANPDFIRHSEPSALRSSESDEDSTPLHTDSGRNALFHSPSLHRGLQQRNGLVAQSVVGIEGVSNTGERLLSGCSGKARRWRDAAVIFRSCRKTVTLRFQGRFPSDFRSEAHHCFDRAGQSTNPFFDALDGLHAKAESHLAARSLRPVHRISQFSWHIHDFIHLCCTAE